MEANMFGTPQAAPGETPVYEPTPQPEQQQPAPQQTPEPQQQPAPTQPAPGQQQEPEDPVMAALTGIRGEIESLKQGQQPQVDPELDLLTALNQEPEEAFEQGGAQVPGQAQQQQFDPQQQAGADPEAQRQLEALEQLIDERASQMIAPLREQQTLREMEAVQKRNPDIMKPEILESIADRIGRLEARTGMEGLTKDPEMVEQMYKLVKAEAADAGAVAPADAGGAVLETNAGQSQTGGSSADEEYINNVFGAQQKTSIFG